MEPERYRVLSVEMGRVGALPGEVAEFVAGNRYDGDIPSVAAVKAAQAHAKRGPVGTAFFVVRHSFGETEVVHSSLRVAPLTVIERDGSGAWSRRGAPWPATAAAAQHDHQLARTRIRRPEPGGVGGVS